MICHGGTYRGGMLKTLILLCLVACTPQYQQPPDDRAPDAAPAPPPDARPPIGCDMGNLPFSRTANVDDSDPIPSGLLGELQDANVGAKRKDWIRPVWPVIVSGAASVAEAVNPAGATRAPVRRTTGACTVVLALPYDQGDTINDFFMSFYGDGTIQLTAKIMSAPDMDTVLTQISTTFGPTAIPAAWGAVNLDVTPTVLGSGPLLLVLTVDGPNIYFGVADPSFVRP